MSRPSRAASELTVFILGFFAVWALRATYGYAIDDAIASPGARTVYATAVKFALWVVPAIAFARWIRREPPLGYLGITAMPTARQWAWCLGLIALFLAAVAAGEILLAERKHFSPGGAAGYATARGMLLLLVTPVLEETLFRGLFVKEIRRYTSPWRTVALTALLFAGIHLPFWVFRNGLTAAVLADAVGAFVFGVVAGWLYLRSASIWPPTVAHIANNLLAAMLVAAPR